MGRDDGGPRAKGDDRGSKRDGSRGPMEVEAGDSVRFRDFDVNEVTIDDEEYVLVGVEHVICKWKA